MAEWLRADMDARSRAPRDYAVLVRQKSDDAEADLANAFANRGLRLRNESHSLGETTLQDLLADEFARMAVTLLRLGAVRRAPAAWEAASSAILALRAVAPDDELAGSRTEATLTAPSKPCASRWRELAPRPPAPSHSRTGCSTSWIWGRFAEPMSNMQPATSSTSWPTHSAITSRTPRRVRRARRLDQTPSPARVERG
jgi:hypothetical protein